MISEDDRKVQQAKKQVIENLDVVVSEGERLTKLIDDVLDLAKIEAGKFTWNMSERLHQAMSSIAQSPPRHRSSKPKKLRLDSRQSSQNCPRSPATRTGLIQVVINLISNAVKFTDAGSITCSARQ